MKPDPIKIGLIGCGGRGTGAVDDCFKSSENVKLTAMADLFQGRIDGSRGWLKENTKVELPPPERCFVGFDGYRRLLDLKDVDLVLLATPPGFRPIHFEAAVEAGKHVFMEKPIGVDPKGVRRVLAAGRKAGEKKLAVVAGTQRRHSADYVEMIRRIHAGEIGKILAGRVYWNMGGIWSKERKPEWSDMEYQCHNWNYFTWLSGDHIVEQHIHNLDVANWAIGAHPIRALGLGGRAVRTDPAKYGHIYDHFVVDYEYPGGVHVMSMCRQYPDVSALANAVHEVFVGQKGAAGSQDDKLWLKGAAEWKAPGTHANPYVQEHADLIASIRAGAPLNETQAVAESTLTAILGRETCYTGQAVTWDEMMSSEMDLSPPKYEFGPYPVPPVPLPGKSR
jgi:predicted dehydrogenase